MIQSWKDSKIEIQHIYMLYAHFEAKLEIFSKQFYELFLLLYFNKFN